MNYLKNSTFRQRLALGTGFLAVGGLLYCAYYRLQKESENHDLISKQTEEMKMKIKVLESQLVFLLEEKAENEIKALQSSIVVLKTKLIEVLESKRYMKKEGKPMSVKERAAQLDEKILLYKLKADISEATRKRPTKDKHQGSGMDAVSTVLEGGARILTCQDYCSVNNN